MNNFQKVIGLLEHGHPSAANRCINSNLPLGLPFSFKVDPICFTNSGLKVFTSGSMLSFDVVTEYGEVRAKPDAFGRECLPQYSLSLAKVLENTFALRCVERGHANVK